MGIRDHDGERGWFPRYRPPVPTVQKVSPAPEPAPATPPPPEPVSLGPDSDYDERDNIITDSPTRAYYRARRAGMSESSAALWAAYAVGLPLVEGEELLKPWTLDQVRRLHFLRETKDRWA